MIKIEQISFETAEQLCRKITASLPEYFGLPECNKHYALGVHSCINFAAKIDSDYIGLLSLNFPYSKNSNIYWMGILPQYQKKGVGHSLVNHAAFYAKSHSAKTMTVETLAPKEADENYLKTFNFYKTLGFSPLLNVKPNGYMGNMVYMLKELDRFKSKNPNSTQIKFFSEPDILTIVAQFAQHNWPKPSSTFETYLKEQQMGERLVWIAYNENQFAGYVTLKWKSSYEPFRLKNIPEIMDLNVLFPFQGQGIGSTLLRTAENEAFKKSDIVGIGVGLYKDYGNAQKLYIKHGYTPNGNGITYNYQQVKPGTHALVDDDLVLWLTKRLK